jgi:hypothetical protein
MTKQKQSKNRMNTYNEYFQYRSYRASKHDYLTDHEQDRLDTGWYFLDLYMGVTNRAKYNVRRTLKEARSI